MSLTESLTTFGRQLVVGSGGVRGNPGGRGRGRGRGGGLGIGGGNGGRGGGNKAVALTDSDAAAYVAAVEAADGETLENGIRTAIDAFVIGLKDDGLWAKISHAAILCGARTIAGSLVPLKGTAPTNVGFVSGDYSRTDGFTRAGSSGKRIDTNVADNSMAEDDFHAAIWVNQMVSTSSSYYFGALASSIYSANTGTNWTFKPRSGAAFGTTTSGTGFISMTRNNGSTFDAYFGTSGEQTALPRTSLTAPSATTWSVFSEWNGSVWVDTTDSSMIIAFYSLGPNTIGLQDEYDARVSTLMSDIAAALA